MLLSSVLYINLIAMIISDWKKRLINTYMLAFFAFLVAYSVYDDEGIYILTTRLESNIFFLIFMFTSMGLYIKLTKRRPKDCIGWGDILFIIALSPLFELRQFLIFLIVTFATTWLLSIVLSKFLQLKTIPLVSCMGVSLIICNIFNKLWI